MLLTPRKLFLRSAAMTNRSNDDAPSSESRISRAEWRRRLWHAAPGLLPFLLWAVPHRDPISPTLRWIMVAVVCGLAGHVFWRYRHIEREGDRERVGAVLGYALSVLGVLLVFPEHAELGLTVLAVLAFGDGSATWGGLTFGGPKLPWNPKKTWAGFVSFLIIGTALASLIYWGETQFNPESQEYQSVSYLTALCCAATAVGLAAIAESLPLKINDNIRVGIAAAVGVTTMHGLLLGL